MADPMYILALLAGSVPVFLHLGVTGLALIMTLRRLTKDTCRVLPTTSALVALTSGSFATIQVLELVSLRPGQSVSLTEFAIWGFVDSGFAAVAVLALHGMNPCSNCHIIRLIKRRKEKERVAHPEA